MLALTAAEQVGLDPSLPEQLRAVASRQMSDGLSQGMQILVARHGRVVVDDALGAQAGTSRPITHATRFHLASASKAITATAVHLLADRGLISYNDPVGRHVQEFAAHGKGAVTVRQTMTHQGGFPDVAMKSAPAALMGGWDAAVAAVCDLELEYEPGAAVVYHGLSAFTILAEIVHRVDGRPFHDFVQQEILDPLGMAHTTWGLPEGLEATDVVGWTEAVDDDVAVWRSPATRATVIPGGNAYSTARDMAALYLSLSREPLSEVRPLLAPATTDYATRLHAPMAPGLGFGFGLGFMVGTDARVLLSRGNLGSERAYGHPGMTFTQALCDPRDGLVMVFLANVALSQDESDRRFGILCDTVYRSVRDKTHGDR